MNTERLPAAVQSEIKRLDTIGSVRGALRVALNCLAENLPSGDQERAFEVALFVGRALAKLQLAPAAVAAGAVYVSVDEGLISEETVASTLSKDAMQHILQMEMLRARSVMFHSYVETMTPATATQDLVRDITPVVLILVCTWAALQHPQTGPRDRLVRLARMARDLLLPVASLFDIPYVRSGLEETIGRILWPRQHQRVTSLIERTFEGDVTATMRRIRSYVHAAFIADDLHNIEIFSRVKSATSTMLKMRKRGTTFQDLQDIAAMRIVVTDFDEVFPAYESLRRRLDQVPDAYDNYINNPKPSGYRAVHDAFVWNGIAFEVQIRTQQDHRDAEYGSCAHSVYKAIPVDKARISGLAKSMAESAGTRATRTLEKLGSPELVRLIGAPTP